MLRTIYENVSKSFRTESIMTYKLTTIKTRWEATKRVMVAKLTRLTHKIAIQLHIVAESCTICSSRSMRPVRKLLDAPSHLAFQMKVRRTVRHQLTFVCWDTNIYRPKMRYTVKLSCFAFETSRVRISTRSPAILTGLRKLNENFRMTAMLNYTIQRKKQICTFSEVLLLYIISGSSIN